MLEQELTTVEVQERSTALENFHCCREVLELGVLEQAKKAQREAEEEQERKSHSVGL